MQLTYNQVMARPQSLHSHTHFSDGKLSLPDLLETAARFNIDTLAITDHDVALSAEQVNYLKNHAPINWISGIEISARLGSELAPEQPDTGIHVVGLFIDPEHAQIKQYVKWAIHHRQQLVKQKVNHLKSLGFEINFAECLQAATPSPMVRSPHLVASLLAKPHNRALMMKLKQQLHQKAHQSDRLQRLHQKVLQAPESQLPYLLFMTPQAFVPMPYFENEPDVDVKQAGEIIKAAGGLSFAAHYFTVKLPNALDILDTILGHKLLDGAETIFGFFEMKAGQTEFIHQQRKQIQAIVTKHQALASGGADAHAAVDLETFVQHPDSRLTANLAQTMLKLAGHTGANSSLADQS